VLTKARRKKILEYLEIENTISSQNLVERLKASESTIRRDLSQLENENKLIRIHGGARKYQELDEEQSMSERTIKNSQKKLDIAELVSTVIDPNDTIFLDAGSTTFALISYLKNKKVIVVTNGIQHAEALAELNINTILIGGNIKSKTKAIIGSVALKQLEEYRFNKVLLGVNGIDTKSGFTTPDIEEAMIKKTAMKNGNQTFFLADSSKFNKITFANVTAIEDQIVMTNQLNQSIREQYDSKIKLVEARN